MCICRYTWSTPIREILGEDFYFQSGYMSNNTMLRDLVAHKTGIPRHDSVWKYNIWTREEIIQYVLKRKRTFSQSKYQHILVQQ